VSTPAKPILRPGIEAIAAKGWLMAHKWLLLRRSSQIGFLLLFLAGPWFGLWIVKGNLAFSYTLNFLPLADPYVILQSVLAGQVPERLAWIGAGIIMLLYVLVGGRAYCSWVCPVNLVTDLAYWLRVRLGLKGSAHISRPTRYWMLGMTLVAAAVTGSIAWEMVNPVSMMHRGLIFGIGLAWAVLLAVFLFDLFVMRHGWCGHLCPVGAFYSLIGRFSLGAGKAAGPRRLQRLHGLFCGLSGAAGDPTGVEGDRRRATDHPRKQLHQLRSLHRCLLEGRVFLRHPFQICRGNYSRSRSCGTEVINIESRLGSPS
jgi:ferredoxin-type protein NapH